MRANDVGPRVLAFHRVQGVGHEFGFRAVGADGGGGQAAGARGLVAADCFVGMRGEGEGGEGGEEEGD